MSIPTHVVLRRLIPFLLADLFGFLCVALGLAWFAGGTILESFPRSTAEAAAAILGGLTVIVWAAGRILRELGRLAPPPPADD